MKREAQAQMRAEELHNSWAVYTCSDHKVKVIGTLGKTTIEIFYIKHYGYTTVWKDAPYFKGHKQAMK